MKDGRLAVSVQDKAGAVVEPGKNKNLSDFQVAE
jgi:hypothetical protein